MDCKRLDELMTIKKKGDTNQDNKCAFQRELINLMNEEGYSERVEGYLYNGFSFAGARPVFEFMKVLQGINRNNFYSEITKGKRFFKDTVVSLKLELHLFALMCNELPQETKIIAHIIQALPGLSKNQDGSIKSNLSKFIGKYLLAVMKEEAQIPALNTLNLKENNILRFRSMLVDRLKNYHTNKKSISIIMKKVHNWVLSSGNLEKRSEEDKLNYSNSIVEVNKSPFEQKAEVIKLQKEHQQDNNAIQKNAIKDEKEKSTIDNTLKEISWKDGIAVIEQQVTGLENQIKDLISTRDRLQTRNAELNRRIEILQNEKEKLNVQNLEIQKRLYNLIEENGDYRTQLENLSAEVDQKKQEIEAQSKLNEMVGRDFERQLEEFTNRLSSKLKVDYKDLMDIISIDMTVELGENMRLQLLNVFEILQKNGIIFK